MKRSVLLVEDEPTIAAALEFLLSREGWELECCDDGAQAVDRFRAIDPQLVILDHMLPGKSGLEILMEIRALPDCCGLPIIMLTARGQPRDREMAERAGVTRFMTKPFSNQEIVSAVRDLVFLAQ